MPRKPSETDKTTYNGNRHTGKTGWLILVLLILTGACFRTLDLGRATMGADVMEYYKICQSGVSAGRLLTQSTQYLGPMPPAWFAAHNAFIQWLGLPVRFGTVRLPDALAGLLTIPAVFLVLRMLKGTRAGLIGAAFMAVQPLHIQMSRECYFYVPIVLGCLIALWALLRFSECLHKGRRPDWLCGVALIAGYYLITNIQISSWPFAVVYTVSVYMVVFLSSLPVNRKWKMAGILTGCFFLIGLPSLLGTWGLRDVLNLTFGSAKDQWGDILEQKISSPWRVVWGLAASYLFGTGWLRGSLSAAVIAGGVYVTVRSWKANRLIAVFSLVALAALGMQAVIHTMSVFPPTPRHYACVFPVFIILAALALEWMGVCVAAVFRAASAKEAVPVVVGVVVCLGVNGYPAWLSTQLTGQPPYMTVVRWADQHLPKDTVVLCDRWFTPWNEFRINAADNLFFTYTIPNEPVQAYVQNKWRETAMQFFEINPLAAFFEGKEYWVRLGPWTWPEQTFARKMEFVDQAGLTLERMGLNYRPAPQDFPQEWLPVTVYYNTEDDVVEQRRARGDVLLPLFGPGWKYTKTNDYRDWYVLNDAAAISVYNLTDHPVNARLRLIGTALDAPKTIVLDGVGKQRLTFQANQMQQIITSPVLLQPGKNEWMATDISKQGRKAPLLIHRIEAEAM